MKLEMIDDEEQESTTLFNYSVYYNLEKEKKETTFSFTECSNISLNIDIWEGTGFEMAFSLVL